MHYPRWKTHSLSEESLSCDVKQQTAAKRPNSRGQVFFFISHSIRVKHSSRYKAVSRSRDDRVGFSAIGGIWRSRNRYASRATSASGIARRLA